MKSRFIYLPFLIFYAFILGFIFHLKEPHPTIYPAHIHTTLYLDRNFNAEEQSIIIEAALEWSMATKNLVEYQVIQLPSDEIMNIANNGIIIIKLNPDYPDVVAIDLFNHRSTLGFFNDSGRIPFIALIPDRLNSATYKRVALHELGHSLGLEHVLDKDTLMYPYVNSQSDSITLADLKQFCKLHRCNVKDLQN